MDFEGYFSDRRPSTLSATARQLEALRYTSHGLGIEATADAMGCTGHSVDDLLERARAGLGAKTTTHAVAIAIRLGLID